MGEDQGQPPKVTVTNTPVKKNVDTELFTIKGKGDGRIDMMGKSYRHGGRSVFSLSWLRESLNLRRPKALLYRRASRALGSMAAMAQ